MNRRDVVVMVRNGMTYEQVAEKAGISRGAVAGLVYRSKRPIKRKAKGVTVTATLKAELAAELKQRAVDFGVSKSHVIQILLENSITCGDLEIWFSVKGHKQ